MEELLKQLSDLDNSLDRLLANDELSEEQQAEHTKLLADREKLQARITKERDRLDRAAERERLAVEEDRRRRTVPATPARVTTPDAPPVPGRTRTDEQGRVTGFFETTDEEVTLRFGEARDAVQRQSYWETKKNCLRQLKAAGYNPWGEFTSFSQFVREGLEGHQNSRFRDKVNRHYAAVQGMSEGIASDGGYLVMPEMAGGIIDRVYSNSLWGRTDNYTVTGNAITFMANAETSRATGSRHGGFRGYWMSGEGSTLTASKPTLREVTLKLAKLGVVVYLTQELIDDGGAVLQSYVARKAQEEFNFMVGDALFNGTGVGQPLGVLNWPSLVSVAKETGQAAATLEAENVLKMHARFYAPNLPGAVWYHNQDIQPELDTMSIGVGAAGSLVYMPPGGLSGAPYATLRGRPMQVTEFNATLGTQGDIALVDLGQMLSISKGGLMQAVSMHVQFLTDQLALRFIMRLNAGPWESAPITPYKGSSNTQSSAVVLDTRS